MTTIKIDIEVLNDPKKEEADILREWIKELEERLKLLHPNSFIRIERVTKVWP